MWITVLEAKNVRLNGPICLASHVVPPLLSHDRERGREVAMCRIKQVHRMLLYNNSFLLKLSGVLWELH
jgi:hypothetical protein